MITRLPNAHVLPALSVMRSVLCRSPNWLRKIVGYRFLPARMLRKGSGSWENLRLPSDKEPTAFFSPGRYTGAIPVTEVVGWRYTWIWW